MPGKSHGVDCLLSGGGNGMQFGGFGLNLSEEISRVMLGNCFFSQRFTCVGSCEASGCSTDTHHIGRGLLRNTVWDALGAKMAPTLHFLHHLVQMLHLCLGGCLEHKSKNVSRSLTQLNELRFRLGPR